MKFIPVILLLGMCLSYPIPVSCQHSSHFPTIAGAPLTQAFGHLGHVGVDYTVPVGTEVYAAMDGIVIYAGNYGSTYGRAVLLLHCDGYMSLYGHLSELKTKFGETVTAGDLIALSGGDPNDKIDQDGASSGAHLHFEVRTPGHLENNLYNVSPLQYLNDHFFTFHFRNFQ